jgi:hypothetical protein
MGTKHEKFRYGLHYSGFFKQRVEKTRDAYTPNNYATQKHVFCPHCEPFGTSLLCTTNSHIFTFPGFFLPNWMLERNRFCDARCLVDYNTM